MGRRTTVPFCHLSSSFGLSRLKVQTAKIVRCCSSNTTASFRPVVQHCACALLFPCDKCSGKCPEKNQASILPAPVHHLLGDERLVDKLHRHSGRSFIRFPVIDDEFSLVSNSCSGKAHPQLIVVERKP